MSSIRILVADDDPKIRKMLQTQLEIRGFTLYLAENGAEALAALPDFEPDLMLLDITMPRLTGLEVCRQAREWSSVPIILLTSTDEPQTKVEALESGADDYVTKPFHMGELVARIRAVLRRHSIESGPAVTTVERNGLSVNLVQRTVCRDGEPVSLTKTEFELLKELITHPDRVLTYEHLLGTVWGPGYDDIRAVHVHICNLRRKIEGGNLQARYIVAVPGVGYRFESGA